MSFAHNRNAPPKGQRARLTPADVPPLIEATANKVPLMPLSNAQARDVQSLLHPYTNLVKLRETGPVVFERGKGVRIYDEHGKDYIEGMAGLWCTALGWGEEALIEVAAEQMRKLSYGHIFAGRSHEPAIALAEKLKEVAPFPVGKVFFANSGSEANDSQIKLFWYANNARGLTKAKKFISRTKAYHGVTMASASLTGLAGNHRSFDLPLDFVRFTDCPHYYRNGQPGESEAEFVARLAKNLTDLIEKEGADTIAAMIAEPVMGAGGVIIPPKGYFDAIVKVLSRYGIPLVDDEVITGFGRTGEWFGAQTYGIAPDIMTMAKGLSSGYQPISAISLGTRMAEVILHSNEELVHGFTYSGHPVASAVALKNLEIMERTNLVARVKNEIGPYLQRRLRETFSDHPLVGEVRGVGLLAAIELVADKTTREFFPGDRNVGTHCRNYCFGSGLVMRAIRDTMVMAPPLIVRELEVEEMIGLAKSAIDRTAKDLGKM
jgi:4-aminobutyrate---pyruvate transaminase